MIVDALITCIRYANMIYECAVILREVKLDDLSLSLSLSLFLFLFEKNFGLIDSLAQIPSLVFLFRLGQRRLMKRVIKSAGKGM